MTTPPPGATERDAALDQLETSERAHGDWYAEALRQARRIARTQELFTSDDVWKAVRDFGEPHTDRRVMGAVMRTVARDDIAYRTRYTQTSTRKSCHSRPISLWRSRIFDPSMPCQSFPPSQSSSAPSPEPS